MGKQDLLRLIPRESELARRLFYADENIDFIKSSHSLSQDPPRDETSLTGRKERLRFDTSLTT